MGAGRGRARRTQATPSRWSGLPGLAQAQQLGEACTLRQQSAAENKDREYQVVVFHDPAKSSPYRVAAAWGRWGQTMQCQEKSAATNAAAAARAANNLISAKEAKGYTQTQTPSTGTTYSPFDSTALESAVGAAGATTTPTAKAAYDKQRWRTFLKAARVGSMTLYDYYDVPNPGHGIQGMPQAEEVTRQVFADAVSAGALSLPSHLDLEDLELEFRPGNYGGYKFAVKYKPTGAETSEAEIGRIDGNSQLSSYEVDRAMSEVAQALAQL